MKSLKKFFSFLVILAICIFAFNQQVANAAGFTIAQKLLYGHKTLDGDLVFFNNYNSGMRGLFLRSERVKLYFCKVILKNDEEFYYFYVNLEDRELRKHQKADFNIVVNGEVLKTELIESNMKDKVFNGWYKLSKGDEGRFSGLKSISISITDDQKILAKAKLSTGHFEVFAKVLAATKNMYIREGRVFDKPERSAREVVLPRLIFPGMSAEAAQGAILSTLRQATNSKTIQALNNDYNITRDPNAPNSMSFIDKKSYDGEEGFAVFLTSPHNDSTLVNLYTHRLVYSRPATGAVTISVEDMVPLSSGSFIVDTREFWRRKANFWNDVLYKTHADLYGKNDYGIDFKVSKGKDDTGSVFTVTAVNHKAFANLQPIEAGFKLLFINGVDTSFMNEGDLKYMFLSNNTSLDCVFANAQGENIKLTLKPIFRPATKSAEIDYVALLKGAKFYKYSKEYIETDSNEVIFKPTKFNR